MPVNPWQGKLRQEDPELERPDSAAYQKSHLNKLLKNTTIGAKTIILET